MKNFVSKYWKSLLAVIIVSYMSFAPASELPRFNPFEGFDKAVHVLMYMFLSSVIIFDNRKTVFSNGYLKKLIIPAIVFPVLFGGIVEIMQEAFFPPRSADWFDWLADITGVAAGFGLLTTFISTIQKKRQ